MQSLRICQLIISDEFYRWRMVLRARTRKLRGPWQVRQYLSSHNLFIEAQLIAFPDNVAEIREKEVSHNNGRLLTRRQSLALIGQDIFKFHINLSQYRIRCLLAPRRSFGTKRGLSLRSLRSFLFFFYTGVKFRISNGSHNGGGNPRIWYSVFHKIFTARRASHTTLNYFI